MRREGQEESRNVEDVRGAGRGGCGLGRRSIGIGTIVRVPVAGWTFAIDPLTVPGVLGDDGGAGVQQSAPPGRRPCPAGGRRAAEVVLAGAAQHHGRPDRCLPQWRQDPAGRLSCRGVGGAPAAATGLAARAGRDRDRAACGRADPRRDLAAQVMRRGDGRDLHSRQQRAAGRVVRARGTLGRPGRMQHLPEGAAVRTSSRRATPANGEDADRS